MQASRLCSRLPQPALYFNYLGRQEQGRQVGDRGSQPSGLRGARTQPAAGEKHTPPQSSTIPIAASVPTWSL